MGDDVKWLFALAAAAVDLSSFSRPSGVFADSLPSLSPMKGP